MFKLEVRVKRYKNGAHGQWINYELPRIMTRVALEKVTIIQAVKSSESYNEDLWVLHYGGVASGIV